MFLFYYLATRVFSVFRCQEVDGIRILQEDFSVTCGQDKHAIFLLLSIAFLIIYCAGIPIGVLLILWRNRKALFDEKHKRHEEVDYEYGGLYQQYEPQYWYFEVIVIIYKMLMTGMLSIVAPGSPVQMVCAILIMQVFLLIVLKLSPYKSDPDDVSVFVSLLALVLITLGGLVLIMDRDKIFNGEHIGVGITYMSVGVLVMQFLILVFVKCGYGAKISKRLRVISGKKVSVMPISIMTEKQKNKEDNRQNSAATEQHKELRDIRLKYGADSEEYKEVALNIQGKQKIDQSAKDRLQERKQQQQQTKQIKQKKTLLKIGEQDAEGMEF